MANSNNIISQPVRFNSDIRVVSKQNAANLGAMSRNVAAVNKQSKCKPMNVALTGAEPPFFYTEEARMAAYKKVCYGLTNIPCFSRAGQMKEWMRGNTASTYPTNKPWMTKGEAWSLRTATIGRAIDWKDYNQNAQPIVLSIGPETLEIPLAGRVYVDVELGYTGITVQDLCQQGVWLPYGSVQHSDASNPTDLRLGLCFIRSGTSSKAGMVFVDRFAYEYSGEFSFSFLASQFNNVFSAPTGKYNVFLFLGAMDVMPDAGELVSVGNQTGVFYPINESEIQMTVQNRASQLVITVSGGKDTESQRTVSFRFEIQNQSNYGTYVYMRVDLVQGDADYVLDSVYLGGRQYLAPRGQSGCIYSHSGTLDAKGQSTDLKVKAVIEVYETDTSFEPVETIEKTSNVLVGTLPLPDVN